MSRNYLQLLEIYIPIWTDYDSLLRDKNHLSNIKGLSKKCHSERSEESHQSSELNNKRFFVAPPDGGLLRMTSWLLGLPYLVERETNISLHQHKLLHCAMHFSRKVNEIHSGRQGRGIECESVNTRGLPFVN